MGERSKLLPPDALKGVRLGISVSESPDLMRLGLLESHFRLAIGEIARCVLVSGGHLAYGGHLDPGGYTAFLIKELERYSRRDRPLLVCLAWTIHRAIPLSQLVKEIRDLGLYGTIECLDRNGSLIDPATSRTESPVHERDSNVQRESLSALRRHMCEVTRGRVFIGGRKSGFQGEMPGVLEEAILSVQAGQPIYLAGGFGGVTLDIAYLLGIDTGDWLPRLHEAVAPDQRLVNGLERLVELANRQGRESLNNGLTREENRKLAASHRPSEIAALVSIGLGRRFGS